MRNRPLATLGATACLSALAVAAATPASADPGPVEVQLLASNDFHGAL